MRLPSTVRPLGSTPNQCEDVFALIRAEKANHPVAKMAGLLNSDRRRYYEWAAAKQAGPSRRESRMAELVVQVGRLHAVSDGTYGALRIRADLAGEGWQVSVKTVANPTRRPTWWGGSSTGEASIWFGSPISLIWLMGIIGRTCVP